MGIYPLCDWCPGDLAASNEQEQQGETCLPKTQRDGDVPSASNQNTATEFEPQPVSASHSYLEEAVDSHVYIITLTWFWEI